MREKELRLALVCYGGVSLAIYMHGITKQWWRVARVSRAYHDRTPPACPHDAVFAELLSVIEKRSGEKLRILPDIIAGASAGGINGVFLAHAIASGQSLEPLTALWLDHADVTELIDDRRSTWRWISGVWAAPLAWWLAGRRGGTIENTVARERRAEVRRKLTILLRARWFRPPFGGARFTSLLLDAFVAMAKGPVGPRLLPIDHPLDLAVTITDFTGYPQTLRLNSPQEILETEHRIVLTFRQPPRAPTPLGDPAELTFAARATASFPGAFPPFTVAELDGVLRARDQPWPGRAAFLSSALAGYQSAEAAARAVLIDGSVLSNAPFRPAIRALRDRSSRREVDRRFVYIDPFPGQRLGTPASTGALPGFMRTIFAALSDIPREQPIRDSLDVIERRSTDIRKRQRIIEALRPVVEGSIEGLFGRTFFLDSPTPSRVENWRLRAEARAASDAGFAFDAYGQLRLAGLVDDIVALVMRQNPGLSGAIGVSLADALRAEARARGIDQVSAGVGKGMTAQASALFRDHDLAFRVRRMRFVVRTVAALADSGRLPPDSSEPLRATLFKLTGRFLEREAIAFYPPLPLSPAAALFDAVAAARTLAALDAQVDASLASVLTGCPRAERRAVLFAYLGFPFFDISTLPLFDNEGLDEFDPIKIDRISPDDAKALSIPAYSQLKGTEFNNFGAFFSRSYREHDYLLGRLHGADRLIDIIATTQPPGDASAQAELASLRRRALIAILDEESDALQTADALIATLRNAFDHLAAPAATDCDLPHPVVT